jgi:nitrile hydratase
MEMADPATRFAAGDRVRALSVDPSHHTRLPRYVRGQVGEVLDVQGVWPLADDRAQGRPDPRSEPVYTVRFAAHDLWGEGSHWVTVALWQSYLEPVGTQERPEEQ